MTGRHEENLQLRRAALVSRARLQRLQVEAAITQVRRTTLGSKGAGTLAMALARTLVQSRAMRTTALQPRPWMLSAGMLLVRALRASPTARWVTGAIVVGGAAWWLAKSLSAADTPGPDGDETTSG